MASVAAALLTARFIEAQGLTTTIPARPVPLGYCQLSVGASVVLLSSCTGGIPAGAQSAAITPSTTSIRYRDDGTAPTATIGFPLLQGSTVGYSSVNLAAVQFIAQTGTATLDINFYGY